MSDILSRSIYHRSVLTNDTPLFTLAERTRLLGLKTATTNPKLNDRLDGLLNVGGAENVQFSFYAVGDNDGTAIATIVGFPPILERMPPSQANNGPRLIRLAVLALTVGTSIETALNPITGLTDSNFAAVDTITTTIAGTTILLLDAAGSNGASRAVIDALRCTQLFCYISGLTNVTRMDVCANLISSF